MPNTCGSVRRKPKLTPDASSIVLFGPGVIEVTSANRMPAGSALRVRKDMGAPVSPTENGEAHSSHGARYSTCTVVRMVSGTDRRGDPRRTFALYRRLKAHAGGQDA